MRNSTGAPTVLWAGTTVTTTYLEVGVLLVFATLETGTNGLASGKYAETLPYGIS
jgi:hypothetical protein